MDIAGKNAFVTGAGAGIGRAIALMLAERGAAQVTVADRDVAAAEATARLIADRQGHARVACLDVTDHAALEAAIEAADREGGIDIMINNAGILGGAPAFPEMSVGRIETVIAINLTAMIAGTKFAVQRMQAHGRGGAVLVTASRAAFNPSWFDPIYTATKAGILMFARSCRDLAAESGIRVNALCPGMTDTPMVAPSGEGRQDGWLKDRIDGFSLITPEYVASIGLSLIEDDSRAGDYELIENQPVEAQAIERFDTACATMIGDLQGQTP